MIIMALGLRRARVGMIPLYRSTLVWTTLTYDCSLLHALEVTTMTLEPAEADKSNKEEICLVKSHIVKQQTLQNSSRRSKPHCCCVKSPLNSGVLLLWRGVKVTAECSTAAPRYSVSARRHRGESSRTGSLSTMPVSLPLIWQQWLSPVARSRYCVTVQNVTYLCIPQPLAGWKSPDLLSHPWWSSQLHRWKQAYPLDTE